MLIGIVTDPGFAASVGSHLAEKIRADAFPDTTVSLQTEQLDSISGERIWAPIRSHARRSKKSYTNPHLATDDPLSTRIDPRAPELGMAGLQLAGKWHAGEDSPSDPQLSTLYRDILLPDAMHLRDRARSVGVQIDFNEFDGIFHNWIMHRIPRGARRVRSSTDSRERVRRYMHDRARHRRDHRQASRYRSLCLRARGAATVEVFRSCVGERDRNSWGPRPEPLHRASEKRVLRRRILPTTDPS